MQEIRGLASGFRLQAQFGGWYCSNCLVNEIFVSKMRPIPTCLQTLATWARVSFDSGIVGWIFPVGWQSEAPGQTWMPLCPLELLWQDGHIFLSLSSASELGWTGQHFPASGTPLLIESSHKVDKNLSPDRSGVSVNPEGWALIELGDDFTSGGK